MSVSGRAGRGGAYFVLLPLKGKEGLAREVGILPFCSPLLMGSPEVNPQSAKLSDE